MARLVLRKLSEVMVHVRRTQIAGDLERFLRRICDVSPQDERFDRAVDLWDSGYLDSLGAVDLIEFLEDRYEVDIPREVLFDPDFVHIDGMARLVEEVILAARRTNGAPEGRAAEYAG